MAELITACMLAWRDLFRPGVFVHALWPPLAATLCWIAVAWQAWSPLRVRVAAALPDWSWLVNSFLGDWLVTITLLLIFAPFVYFTTLVLTSTFALPRMMSIVAASDYAELERRGKGVFISSLINAIGAGVLFVLGWLLTVPLMLIPGVILILPLWWTAWINQRTFRFDALAEHAAPPERYLVIRDARGSFYTAGFFSALLAHVPIVNLIAPAWTALLFVHLGLLRLRRLRQEGAVWEGERA